LLHKGKKEFLVNFAHHRQQAAILKYLDLPLAPCAGYVRTSDASTAYSGKIALKAAAQNMAIRRAAGNDLTAL
jgi:hypothetical protein